VPVVAANATYADAAAAVVVVDVAVFLLPNADIIQNVDEPHINTFFAPTKVQKQHPLVHY
jgi:hypothetical protein